MKIRISFMGVIADITGTKEQTVELPAMPTLRGLLTALEEQYGTEFGVRIFRSATAPRLLQMCTRIFINRNIVTDQALDGPLSNDANSSPEILVYFLPAACGG